MNFSLVPGELVRASGEVWAVPVFEEDLKGKATPTIAKLNQVLKGVLLKASLQEGFKGKADQTFVLHTHGRVKPDRIVLLGLGARARYRPETLRLAAGRAAKAAARIKAKSLAFAVPLAGERPETLRAVVEGLELGAYRFDRYRTTAPEEKNAPRLDKVTLVVGTGENRAPAILAAVRLGKEVAEATNWARDLVNEPAGTLTPTVLAEAAEAMAKEAGLEVEVQGRKEIAKLRMGMFLGVAQGSAEPPRLIRISYVPKDDEAAKRPPVALVGKAITFDSGGLSLKPADGMVDMKTDMAGSAAVFGAMRVIAKLAPPFPVHAFVGTCENMPSGTAYRPGDVLISRLGKTVEITNTDAEGRLVLGDVLAWANEWKPSALIDLATLTGACMVALGNYITGLFADDDALANEVLSAGKASGEELWRLPVTELQRDALRSEIADMKNSGERWGGATNAALFLKEFVGNTPWVHLDIAGPSQSPKERGYYGKGATGVGVRTLVELVRQRTLSLSTSVAPELAARAKTTKAR